MSWSGLLVATRRIMLASAVAILLGSSYFVLAPAVLTGQTEDGACEFQDPNNPDPDFHECDPDAQHIYDGTCEGTDCYPRMEECC